MKKKTRSFSKPPRDGSTLWYLSPAPDSYEGWENAALPIGNGSLGAKIYGGAVTERIQFNEKSLWSGGPGVPGCTGGNAKNDGGASLKEIQALLAKQDFEAATKKMCELQGNETGLGAYQNFGDLVLRFDSINESRVSGYIRDLDLKTATASVSFEQDGIQYRQEFFANYPHNVMAVKLTASQKNCLSFQLSAKSAQHGTVTAVDNTITMAGNVTEWLDGKEGANKNSLRYACIVSLNVTDGTTAANPDGSLTVKSATEATLLLCAATDYKNEYPHYRSGIDPMETVQNLLTAAEKAGYEALLEEHIADYQKLFYRMQLHVGETPSLLPTDELLRSYKHGTYDPALEMLYFQYGRYLLISSSRPGALPANLQGIWNAKNNPPWQSDYHLNVNMQMIYWPAMSANLWETAPPMIDYINSLRKPGRITAKSYVGVGAVKPDGTPDPEQATGWMTHTQNNIFGNTGPGSVWRWGWAPTAGAWMTQNMYEYYAYTMDAQYLQSDIYPAMEECALLWSQLLIEDEATGRLVSSPSFSPENGPVAAGNTFDQELIWQLYENTRNAAAALMEAGLGDSVNQELIEKITEQQKRLRPLEVGAWGQIKEWPQEDQWKDRGFRSQGVEKNHRHMSHLLGLFPGTHITENTPDYFAAAKVSVADRQNIPWYRRWNPMLDTGWSKAQKLCSWARLKEGDRSYQTFRELLKHSTLSNLWDTHPPFQLDGNLGAVAGIAEMLLQSHTGEITLLPALPAAWSKQGEVKGICARGGFVLDFQWSDGTLTALNITSLSGGSCTLSFTDIASVAILDMENKPVEAEVLGKDKIRISMQQQQKVTFQF